MGKIKKIAGAFVHAPDRFDELAERIVRNDTALREVEERLREQIGKMDIDWFMDQLCDDREKLSRLPSRCGRTRRNRRRTGFRPAP